MGAIRRTTGARRERKSTTGGAPAGRIVPRPIVEEMQESFARYAMSVIVARALPDVRDGLKPVQRRILYAMHELGLTPGRPYKKSATIVGDVLGKYHPHGDSSVYDALVRLVQDFSMRYPLIDGQGNFGSIDGDAAAAYRYTEARLTPVAVTLLDGLEEDAVAFGPNFDDRLEEPVVLPAGAPALLINGNVGIAVGMATNCVPHNAREVLAGCLAVLDEPSISTVALRRHIKGPDFPTGGVIVGRDGIVAAQETGQGSIVLRGRTIVEPRPQGRAAVVVTELPYAVNKEKFVTSIAELHHAKKFEGLAALRDESDRDGMRVVLELKKDVAPEPLLRTLYKHTNLQVNVSVLQLALVPDPGTGQLVPRRCTLRDLIDHYLAHRRVVLVNRTAHRLAKAEARATVVAGLLIAVASIDAVVALIKAAPTVDEAKRALMAQFGLQALQAEAVLALRLARLAALEVQALRDEAEALTRAIADYQRVLASPEVQTDALRSELRALLPLLAEPRRTQIIAEAGEQDVSPPPIPASRLVWATATGRLATRAVPTGKGKGGGFLEVSTKTRADAVVKTVAILPSNAVMLVFTADGRVRGLQVGEIPEVATGGVPLSQIVDGAASPVVRVVPLATAGVGATFLLVTARGLMKRLDVAEVQHARLAGVRVMAVAPGDAVVAVVALDADGATRDVVAISRNGRAIRFPIAEIRVMGREAAGVKAMVVPPVDALVGVCAPVHPSHAVTCVADNGTAMTVPVSGFPRQARGGVGVVFGGIGKATIRGVIPYDLTRQLVGLATDGAVAPLEWDAVAPKQRTAAWNRPAAWRDIAPMSGVTSVPRDLPAPLMIPEVAVARVEDAAPSKRQPTTRRPEARR